ncbi:MAG: hypothetical protein HOI95_26015 [Chromatiales bacterium]|nr:hypothetical protein [Chromatiales bacterium]
MTKHLVAVVQNLMGTGHQRRVAAILGAAVRDGWRATMISGGIALRNFRPDGYQVIQLPPTRCPDLAFDRLVDEHGDAVDDAWRERRKAALLDAVAQTDPDVLMVESFPFGRKLLRFELIPMLEAFHAQRAGEARAGAGQLRKLVVCSIRDIIEKRGKRAKYEVMADAALSYFDWVLVHSDPQLVPFEATFPPFERIAQLVRYTGYVRDGGDGAVALEEEVAIRDGRHRCEDADGDAEVLVSTGGGAYGMHVMRAALTVRRQGVLGERRWRFLVGEHVSEKDFQALLESAESIETGVANSAEVIVERVRSDFRELLGRAFLSVSQGGYNTVLDILDSGVRALIVAYHDESEQEQLLRARILEARGFVHVIPNGELTQGLLGPAIERATREPTVQANIDLDGAQRTVELLATALGGCPRIG